MLPELGQQLDGRTTIHDDNMNAIALAKNPIDHKRILMSAIISLRELIANETLMFNYTNEMMADELTKALTPAKFSDFIDILGLTGDGLEEDH